MSRSPVDDFLSELSTQRRSSSHTLDAYRADLDKLSTLAGSTSLSLLTAHDIRRYVATLHARGLAPASIARTLSAWRSLYRYLSERGIVPGNPVAGQSVPGVCRKRCQPIRRLLSQALRQIRRGWRAATTQLSSCCIRADCGWRNWYRSTIATSTQRQLQPRRAGSI